MNAPVLPIPRIADMDDPAFDPFMAEELVYGDLADPYPRIAALREAGPVHPGAYRELFTDRPDPTLGRFIHHSVFGYEAVSRVLTDPETFTNEAFQHNLGLSFGRTISTMDAPEHPAYRRIFQKAFLPQVVATWGESLVDPVVQTLVSAFEGRGRADLVRDFTLHYPFNIIYRQLELPAEDVKTFHKLAVGLTVMVVDMESGLEASRKLGDYFAALVTERRRSPDAGLVSVLATAEADGQRIPDEVLISFLRQLMNAGGDTTYRATSVLLACLLSNPEQLEAVRRDRGLVPKAIDEALRWDGPVTSTWRWVARDVELGGVALKAGTVVDVVLGSANRDPLRYPDPDRFDIFREQPPRHLAFATGPHVCIGQHLARVEMSRALNALLDRLPNLRLDPHMPPPEIRGFLLRKPRHIHVLFD
ncbi:cytochrome P450 [Phenylobacterium sp.]|uniref:cytochrome P450 n=1 Tax=Phenylobacterium sp. TaxID=1871053 RepID=UPI002DE74E96|nr:cytochrome P450 [Phenylobacterium sp.]